MRGCVQRINLTSRIGRVAAITALLAVAAATGLMAQEQEPSSSSESEAGSRNSLGLFVGATVETEEETAFTLGLDYERRLSRRFGVGAMFDKPFGGSRSFIVLGGFFWHPLRPVRLDVAPGIEVRNDESDSFVLRLGADYDIEISERWSIAPNVNLDLVSGRTVWVLGAELGYTF